MKKKSGLHSGIKRVGKGILICAVCAVGYTVLSSCQKTVTTDIVDGVKQIKNIIVNAMENNN